ncbi:ribosomal protein S18-alanine N-acetyltransferase [Propionispora hippei]|uniref:[Ribosomal protein bS18]-alanine N-acetyltransferase n=1 Tax=Propionispora hippei DSM 15287 TaxID=1123003 RepID=A0A1M6C3S0_9FIRM|nr:ribosomal protein S18-alanine N-acetyltransferase [Propionispora hippei]SHI55667.1 ribosomal-protein-alanine N-acetyltransferase [Propionispora hippei DSM 15287]
MSNICIRRMGLLDIDAVLLVEQASFLTPWSRAAFESEICNNELTHYLVVCVEKQVVGYAGMWVIVDEAHVTNIAILPEYRGRGIGEKLLIALKEAADSRGAARMTLEVRPSNNAAKRLYEKLGFSRAGVRKHYYTDTKEDAIIMWCDKL